ncbi:MAG: serine/threonine protein kinase [Gemmataceae bacterium]
MAINEKELAQRTYLGRYQHLRLLGEGGMALVCLAQRANSNLQVVVKVMQERFIADPKCREAFRREMDFMKRFRHPYAVGLFEATLDDPGGPCIVMEFVEGTPLNEVLDKEKRLPPGRVGVILNQLSMALQAMHALGYVHRDLKTGNLMVLEAGTPNESIKLLDFGLARKMTGAGAGATPFIPLEKISQFAEGTPEYMSPEHLQASQMDHRSDIYSVGIILYELLTGHRPFEASDVEGLLRAHAYDDPPPFSKIAPGLSLPAALEKVVQACLAKEPEDRPQTARELVQCYEKALGIQLWDEQAFREALPPPSVSDQLEETPNPAATRVLDANSERVQLEAWMPESIAVMKLRGFLNDIGGEVTDSVPGMIRVYLKRPRAVEQPASGGGILSWLGLKKSEVTVEFDMIEMEVYMEPHPSGQANHLLITILLRIASGKRPDDWKGWCDKITRDITAYLMAKRLDQ